MVICNTYIHYSIMGLAFLVLVYINLRVKIGAIDHLRSFNKQLTSLLIMLLVSAIMLAFLWNLNYSGCPACLT